MMRALRGWITLGLVGVYLVLGVATLHEYGATWDECENMYTGEAHLHFLRTGDARLLDFSKNRLDATEAPLYWQYAAEPERYPPATNILAAGLKHVVSDSLGLVNDLDGYHLVIVLLGSALLFVLAMLQDRREGALSALATVLALGFHPRFFSDLHNNLKDLPETVWYTCALLLAYRAHIQRRTRDFVGFGLCLGVALATKPNALLLPAIFALWLGFDYLLRGPAARAWGRTLLGTALALGLAALSAIALWPWLWVNGLVQVPARLAMYFDYLEKVGTTPRGFTLLAPYYLWVVTPLWTLVLAGIGMVRTLRSLRRREDADGFGLLLLVWFTLPLARLCLPGARFYDGIRHFLEVLPPLALFAGRGMSWVVQVAARWLPRPRPRTWGFATALCAAAALPIATYHPHENVYFNELVGGYQGARAEQVPWANEYWSGSLRQAVEWIDQHGEPGFRIVALDAGQVLSLLSTRPDLVLDPDPEAAEHLTLLGRSHRPMRYYAIETRMEYPEISRLGRVVYERRRDGAPVFRIHRIERITHRASRH